VAPGQFSQKEPKRKGGSPFFRKEHDAVRLFFLALFVKTARQGGRDDAP
jgi:hypothetical protein